MEFLLSPPTLSRRPSVQQPGVGLRETSWKPRPAASGLQCCGRALGLCGRLQRCSRRGHTCRALACLCSTRILPLRPRRARSGSRAEPGPPSRVCLLVPKSTSCRCPCAPMAPCGSQQAALNPAGPRQAVTSRPLGPLAWTPPPLGEQGGSHEGQVSSGRPCGLDPPAPATGSLHPESAGQLRTWGGDTEAQRDTLGKPGTWNHLLPTTSSHLQGGEGAPPQRPGVWEAEAAAVLPGHQGPPMWCPRFPLPTPVLRGGLGAAGACLPWREGLLQPRLSETSLLNLMNSRKVKEEGN